MGAGKSLEVTTRTDPTCLCQSQAPELTDAMEDAGHGPARELLLGPRRQELTDVPADLVLPVLEL